MLQTMASRNVTKLHPQAKPKRAYEPSPEAVKLRQLREAKPMSREHLAKLSGYSVKTIQKWETGERNIRLSKIDELVALIGHTRDDVVSASGIAKGEHITIPERGIVNGQKGDNVWILPRRYLMDELRVPPGKLTIHEVKSDAMKPTLLAGDRVLVNLEDKNVAERGLFLISDGSGDALWRIEAIPGTKPATVKLFSDNPQYSSYEARLSELKVLGRVVWYARRI